MRPTRPRILPASLLALLFILPLRGEGLRSARAETSSPAATPATAAQGITLKGKIRENGTRKSIVGATVMLFGPNNLTLTEFSNERGEYKFEKLAPGPYQVSVLAATYVIDKPRALNLPADSELFEANFFLTPDVTGGLSLEVEAEREKRSVSTQKVQKEEIRRVPGTLGDPLRVIQLMPGVSVMNEVFADLIVQGGGPDDNRIWLDRTPMAFPYHLLNSSSVLSGEFVETQTLHAAGFGVQYGSATGGVLEIESSDGKEDGIGGHATAVGVYAKEAKKFRMGRLEGSLQFGRHPFGSILGASRYLFPPPTIPEVRFMENGGPSFQFSPVGRDYQLKYTFKPKKLGTLRLLGYGAYDKEDQSQEFSGTDPRSGQSLTVQFDFLQRKEFNTQGGVWELIAGPVTSRLSLYHMTSKDDFKIGFPLLKLESFIDRRESNRIRGVWEELEIRAGRFMTFYVGTQVDRVHSRVDGAAPVFLAGGPPTRPPEGGTPPAFAGGGTSDEDEEEEKEEEEEFTPLSFEPFQVEESFNTYAVYLEDRVRLFERLTVAPGIRMERSTLIRKSDEVPHRDVLMPRAYATFQLLPKTELRSGWGIYRRYPEVDQATDQGELDKEGNISRQFGNPYLLPERAEHYTAGVVQKLTEGLRVETDVFHKKLTRLIVGEPENNEGRGYAQGIQLLVRHDLTRRFFGWVSYAYVDSKRRRRGADEFIRTQWDQPHQLSVVSSVKITPNWIVGATYRFTSGSPYTPLFNDEKRDPDLDEDTEAEALPTELNSGRLIDFQRLDLRVDRSVRLRYAELSFFLDLFNVYNRKNEIFRIPVFEDPGRYFPLSTAGMLLYGGVTARF